jgi:hypothetical protein
MAHYAWARFDLSFYDFCSGGAILYKFDFAVYSGITIRCRPLDLHHVRHDPVQFHDPGPCVSVALGPLFDVRTFPFSLSDKLLE